MAVSQPVKVAILWHMHQPNYQEPGSNRMVLPWVRLHAIKDYLDMPLMAVRYENVKTTFNLVPSLLDQFQLYLDGGSDNHLDLSRLKAESLTEEQRHEILATFFSAHPPRMIEPHNRYRELYQKLSNCPDDLVLPALFSSEELRDLQVWSNLVWVDPLFANEEPIRSLLQKERHFSEEEKQALLDWQMDVIARIVPTHRDLYNQGLIDISFTPYYHPILPLLCDTESAREALPSITLPKVRFCHPEDAERQIAMSMEKFEELFDRPLQGMWPSEGSVSEEVADICLKLGVKWIASDEEILYHSLVKSTLNRSDNPLHTVYEYGPGLKLFFRDHAISDRIGFVYSGWDADRAVDDFMSHLKRIGGLFNNRMENVVIPVILDGENAWEYFPNDAHDFLDELYRQLSTDPEIETVTMTEAATSVNPRQLPSIFAGSWINHNFRIWIGHEEDNTAWDYLAAARDALVTFESKHQDYNSVKLKAAWQQIYIAEGSDWCWWYGDEHRGAYNEQFDNIFRRHLINMYELLGLDVPIELFSPIFRGTPKAHTILPDDLITPVIDGHKTHFYEWAGAGSYNCVEAGGAMHRAEQYLSEILFAYDSKNFYIRLDFIDRNTVESIKEPVLQLICYAPERKVITLPFPKEGGHFETKEVSHAVLDEVLELAVPRRHIWTEEFGKLGFIVSLLDGRVVLESWPEDEPIKLQVFQTGKELFWPTG
ncbi:MAG: glycoside hydrolase [Candidatus Zixiibacteriota bacterium]|nr:MAG: glycoside hydrolase [candidate division Zixibacteria bacterium]